MEEYGKEMSLLGAVITRWGSQYTMMESIKRSESALSRLALRADVELPNLIREIIQDDDFWVNLGKLMSLLKLIHEAIQMSESTRSDLSKVLKRWTSINTHLVDCERFKPFETDLQAYNASRFTLRMEKQVSDFHWTIFYLDPVNSHLHMTPAIQKRVNKVIQQYCANPGMAIEEFASFRAKDGSFYDAACWEYAGDAKQFWRMQVSLTASKRSST